MCLQSYGCYYPESLGSVLLNPLQYHFENVISDSCYFLPKTEKPDYNYTEGVCFATNMPGVFHVVTACLQFCNLYPI